MTRSRRATSRRLLVLRAEAPLLTMLGAHAAPLVIGAGYILLLDLDGRTKGAVGLSALLVVSALVAIMVFVVTQPLADPVMAAPPTS